MSFVSATRIRPILKFEIICEELILTSRESREEKIRGKGEVKGRGTLWGHRSCPGIVFLRVQKIWIPSDPFTVLLSNTLKLKKGGILIKIPHLQK